MGFTGLRAGSVAVPQIQIIKWECWLRHGVGKTEHKYIFMWSSSLGMRVNVNADGIGALIRSEKLEGRQSISISICAIRNIACHGGLV